MLQAMREGTHSQILKFILFGLLMLGVGGLVFTNFGNTLKNSGYSATDVAIAGDTPISLRKFDNTARSILRNQGMDTKMAYQLGYINQILMGEIQNALLSQNAKDLGIVINEKEVASRIKKLIEPMLDGSSTPQEALNMILATQGISERQFIESIRKEMSNNILMAAIQSGGMVISDTMLEDLYMFDHERRAIEYVKIDEESFKKEITAPTDEELKEFYQAIKEDFAKPERRTLVIAEIDPQTMTDEVEISDEELRQVYEETIVYYTLPEKRKMAQAIVNSQDVAQKIYELASKGKPLQSAVKEITGSADNYVDEQEFEKEGLIENVADLVFSTDEGSVAEPVNTPMGWHVIKVTKITPATEKPFEEVKNEIRETQMQALLADRLYELSGELDDYIAGGATMDDAIETFSLKKRTYDKVCIRGLGPDMNDLFTDNKDNQTQIIKTGFELVENEISPVIELATGGYAIVHLKEIQPKSWPELDEVKGEVSEKWISRKQKMKAIETADKLLSETEEGISLEEAAKKAGYKTETVTIERTDSSNEQLSVQARMKFFTSPKSKIVVTATEGGQIVGQVSSISFPDTESLPEEEKQNYADTLARIHSNELSEIYLNALSQKYGVKINSELLQKAYGAESEGSN